MFPAWLHGEGMGQGGRRPNLSGAARRYLDALGLGVEDLFHHVLAILHDPAYRTANAAALATGWPRIPLPGWSESVASVAGVPTAGRPEKISGDASAGILIESAARGRELARLLDPDTPVPGVTEGVLRPEIAAIAVPSTTDGRNMTADDFALSAGWGHFGQGDAVMPGQGRTRERACDSEERTAMGDAMPVLGEIGERTVDVHLNDRAFWRNVPARVWAYQLGGYRVLKKWLSYRERELLGRPLSADEVQYFTDTARRIAAILLLTSKPLRQW